MLLVTHARRAAALTAGALLLALPPAAHAAGWAPSAPVAADATGAPLLAADAHGGVLAAFVRGGAVQVAERAASGAFGASRAVSDAGAGQPALAVNANGDAVLAWVRDGVVEASVRPAGRAFGPAAAVSAVGAGDVRVGIDASGAATALWIRADVVETRRRSAGGAWGAVGQVAEAAPSAPALTVAPDGSATAVWTANAYQYWVLRRMHRPAGAAAFGAPATQGNVDDAVGNPVDADLAADAAGTVTGVWGDHNGEYRKTRVAGGRSTGGAFAQSIISDGPVNGHAMSPRPAVAVNPAGDAAAVWLHRDFESPAFVEVARRAGAGAFAPPVTISATAADPHVSPDVAIDPQARVAAVWATEDGTVEGARAAAGFAPAQPLSAPGATAPAVVFDARGNAVAVWRRGAAIETATHDVVAPALGDAQAPARGLTGASLRFTGAASDTETGASVAWDFGDGTATTGADVTHVFAKAGTYTVSAAAVDGAGNRSAARTFTVTIDPIPVHTDHRGTPVDRGSVQDGALREVAERQVGTVPAAGRDAVAPRVSALKVTAARRRIALRLSEAATVTFRVERRNGRRAGKAFTRRLAAGAVTAKLPRLTRGRYRLVVTARDAAGNTSPAARIAFRR